MLDLDAWLRELISAGSFDSQGKGLLLWVRPWKSLISGFLFSSPLALVKLKHVGALCQQKQGSSVSWCNGVLPLLRFPPAGLPKVCPHPCPRAGSVTDLRLPTPALFAPSFVTRGLALGLVSH